jgi:SRSO17 transposase
MWGAAYGVDTAFRERLTAMGLPYVVGVTGAVTVWPPGREPSPPEPYSGRGRVDKRQRTGHEQPHRPQSIKALAFELEPAQWHMSRVGVIRPPGVGIFRPLGVAP